LLEALGAMGKPLIVVLTTGGALSAPWVNEHADALLARGIPVRREATRLRKPLPAKTIPRDACRLLSIALPAIYRHL